MKRQPTQRPSRRRSQSENQHPLQDPETRFSIEQLCELKAEEFRMYGYENVTGEQIWECVSENYRHGYPRLNRIVNDIMSLKVNHFMNWLMISAYKDA